MKHIRLLVVAVAFAASNLSTFASSLIFGPVTIKLSSIQQIINDQTTTSTNINSSSTNITQTVLSTTQTTTINNSQLLDMLANSFNTTWPSGAALKFYTNGDFVVVKGSTIVQDVNTVFSVGNGTGIFSGTKVDKTTINPSGESKTEMSKGTTTASSSLYYDDSGLATANGKTTRISLNGINTIHSTIAPASSGGTYSFVFSFIGTGTGSISNALSDVQLFVSGTCLGAGTMSIP